MSVETQSQEALAQIVDTARRVRRTLQNESLTEALRIESAAGWLEHVEMLAELELRRHVERAGNGQAAAVAAAR